MKFFANKNFFKKIVLTFVLLFSFTFVLPKPVQAVGGEIMNPICDFIVGFGDGAMNVMHKAILRQDVSLIRISDGGWNIAQVIIVAAAVIVIGVALVASGGALVGAGFLAGAKIVAGTIAVIAATGVSAGVLFHVADCFSDEIPLPLYSLSPENILSGKIPLFDVNFINPSEEPMPYDNTSVGLKQIAKVAGVTGAETQKDDLVKNNVGLDYNSFISGADVTTETRNVGGIAGYFQTTVTVTVYTKEYNGNKYVLKEYDTSGAIGTQKNYELYGVSIAGNSGELKPYSYELQGVISKWYVILRTIAIVAMMSVLVYIGIRIVISSTSSDKAKYKQMLGDWLMGMILLFTMHYIMNFSNIAVNSLTNLLTQKNLIEDVNYIPDKVGNKEGLAKQTLDEKGVPPDGSDEKALWRYYEKGDENIKKAGQDDSVPYVEWHTNLMGTVRILANIDKESKSDAYIGYTLVYLVLVIYTFIFSWTYIRRVIYMAFLTLISPLVALTYPIDKVNDGKAQGFDYWFKEYMFNLLLQPMHLLIYTILVTSALEFTHTNLVYTLVALGFISTAEKIVRTMFNFQKASTPGVFAGPAGAALTMTGMRWLMGHGPRGKGNPGKLGSDNGESSKNNNAGYSTGTSKVKMRDLLNGTNNPTQNNDGGENPTQNNDGGGNPTQNNDGGGNPTQDNDGGGNLNNNNRRIRMPRALRPIANRASRYGRGLADTASYYGRGLTGKFSRNLKNGKPIRTLARLGAGAASGATLGMVGLAAGITSGDVSKTLQYAGAGLAGGYKLGTGVADSTIDALSVQGTGDEFTRNMHGEEEYQRIQAETNKRNYKNEKKNIDILRQKNNWSRKEAEDFLNGVNNDRLVELCLENNITDISSINDLRKVRDNDDQNNMSEEELVATFNTNQALFGGSTNTNKDTMDKMKVTLKEREFKDTADPERFASETIDRIEGLQKSLNRVKGNI